MWGRKGTREEADGRERPDFVKTSMEQIGKLVCIFFFFKGGGHLPSALKRLQIITVAISENSSGEWLDER